jgi:hypothetical protein
MNDSNSSANPHPPRATLKLKTGTKKTPDENKTASPPRAASKTNQKAGAHWSDEYKRQMQADMDALTSR